MNQLCSRKLDNIESIPLYNQNFTITCKNSECHFQIFQTCDVFSCLNPILNNCVSDRKCLIIVDEFYCRKIQPTFLKRISDYFDFYGKKSRIISEYNNDQKDQYVKDNDAIFIGISKSTEDNGAEYKNVESVEYIIELACQCKLPRNGFLIGIGGGVTLDKVGLAAALYLRKIQYIRIPTTLLGQIDAGVGLKVGVNFCGKKNVIGSFYPPYAVINDSLFLATLSDLDLTCGFAEIIKVGIAFDDQILTDLEKMMDKLINFELSHAHGESCNSPINDPIFKQIIGITVKIMLNELQKNPFEDETKRKLDFGHSFSQTIEALSKFRIPHGIAVAIDMYICICISHSLKLIPTAIKNRYLKLFYQYNLAKIPFIDGNNFIADKQSEIITNSINNCTQYRGGAFNLVLPVSDSRKVIFANFNSSDIDTSSDILTIRQDIFYEYFENAIHEFLFSCLKRDF